MRKVLSFVAAALIAGLTSSTASAGPLAYLTVLGSSDGINYFPTLQVAGGQTYDYEVILSMAAIGTTNTNGGGRTITSLVAGVDGSNSMSFSVNNTASNPIPVTFSATPFPPQQSTGGTLASFWTIGSGAGPGTLTAGDTGINDVRPIATPGGFEGVPPALVFSGTFTTPASLAAGLSSLINLSWGNLPGSLVINDDTVKIPVTTTIQAGTDPYIAYNALTLTTPAPNAVPEPASLVMAGLGFVCVTGLMVVRRRRMA